ncbi:GNAT family N-acetyltransferase [Mucilaginibacter sp. Bleaf8]|uniref:GNAT family N-acetyltransferase n=1 Tax=Mucilaginibacter sp. Bleaf8 TaxID=2834430 RepID=UPI001BCBC97C|nr:GNAT family N-acetyltransferase [Mucilaginibacter sp. Bleaf8]MBS7563227.1 GNAT family N-acetyltransferase [Mucilaginibacter sp. Bleaf8]
MKIIMNTDAFLKKGFEISTDNSKLDINLVYDFLINESYWATGMSAERLNKAIQNSLCFGIYHDKQQCGFARVVTDMATFAYLCDVFVLKNYRGMGLSKWLIQTIREHPELKGLRRWSLATADAHGLYEQFGFKVINRPERWMEIFTPYTTTADAL